MAAETLFDIFVIGGGINGCGIARDAAGRGYSVYLAEQSDLASGTSSASTKLIHGGLRYLEYYEFRLVRESLMEREVLWAMAPHIIHPMRFVLPYMKGIRPAWMIRLGLFLYDHIGGRRKLPATRTIDLRRDPAGKPLKPVFTTAFEYSDGWVDDARLVVLNARDAFERGAIIRTRSRVVAARRSDGVWCIRIEDGSTGAIEEISARLLVNAAGPWVDHVLSDALGETGVHNVRLVQGSHIVVRRKFDDPRAFFFQNRDGRIIFAIPYQDDFTLIGTTDRDHPGDPHNVRISEEETDYLCAAASEYFAEPVGREDIVWTYSGVRPLYDDGASAAQAATRDYVLREETGEGGAALISVFGGKITTYRRLAEHALEKIGVHIGARGPSWTAASRLPGGDFAAEDFGSVVRRLREQYPFLTEAVAPRLVRQYGTDALEMFGDPGRHFGHGLYEAEIRHLVSREWAVSAEDILWRRTKLGLRFSAEETESLKAYLRDSAVVPEAVVSIAR